MTQSDELARIITGCQQGDEHCFGQLVDLYAGRLYGYFYRLTGHRDVSDELLSELYVKLVERIGSYRGGAFEAWLFRIASNLFHDYLRRKQRQKEWLETAKAEFASDACEHANAEDERSERLQVQLGRLDADTRELIVLRFYSQMSFKEMARMRSEPLGTTLARMHRGLKKLREFMKG